MNVLSLFNGMNTGRQALENVGIKVDKYYSSEIKPYAIELTQHHFPDTIQIGDVTKWKDWDIEWGKIDLVLSGSPCQDLSAAGKRAGINGSKSSLFFVFVDILNHIKSLNPKVLFLQENVGSAPKLDVGIMSRALGVYPVRINSSLVTAQLRDRYYWSNIRTKETMFDLVTDIPLPKDKKIMLKDIITDGFVERDKALALLESEGGACTSQTSIKKSIKRQFINAVYQVNASKESQGTQPFMQNRIYDVQGKSVSLTECLAHKIKYQTEDKIVRTINKIEMCRLQGFPDNYCDILSTKKAGSLLGDGWTLPIIEHIFKFINI
jgi:DNA (cytosine-5)-methyltransferase 3A